MTKKSTFRQLPTEPAKITSSCVFLSKVVTFTKFLLKWQFLLYSFNRNRCAKDIDTLIESLPNEESSQEIQAQSFRRLEVENQEAAKLLEEVRWKFIVFQKNIHQLRTCQVPWKLTKDYKFALQAVERGQQALEKIQAALGDIAQAQLDMEYSLDTVQFWKSSHLFLGAHSHLIFPHIARWNLIANRQPTSFPSGRIGIIFLWIVLIAYHSCR